MAKTKYDKSSNFSSKQLSYICEMLNSLSNPIGLSMYDIRAFYSKNKYIDFQERNKKFAIYRKYKGWYP